MAIWFEIYIPTFVVAAIVLVVVLSVVRSYENSIASGTVRTRGTVGDTAFTHTPVLASATSSRPPYEPSGFFRPSYEPSGLPSSSSSPLPPMTMQGESPDRVLSLMQLLTQGIRDVPTESNPERARYTFGMFVQLIHVAGMERLFSEVSDAGSLLVFAPLDSAIDAMPYREEFINWIIASENREQLKFLILAHVSSLGLIESSRERLERHESAPIPTLAPSVTWDAEFPYADTSTGAIAPNYFDIHGVRVTPGLSSEKVTGFNGRILPTHGFLFPPRSSIPVHLIS